MKILITGGAGFIGSHIQDAYLKAGHQVAVLDNLITGSEKNLNPAASFYKMDIRSPEVVSVFEGFKPEVVSHHAAQMNVRKSVVDPGYDAQVNVLGLVQILEASRKVGVKKVIFASSGGAIYGEQERFPADESHPIRPASPYGLTKRVGEEYLQLYERLYGLSSISLRYANVYGPRQNPHGEAGVVAIFCDRLLKGKAPTINGDGKQTRDYVYVEDVVAANLLALQQSQSGVYNIGTGQETDVNQFAHLLGEFAGNLLVEHGPAKPGEQRRSVIDPHLANQKLNWESQVPLRDGLKKTWEWFEKNKCF